MLENCLNFPQCTLLLFQSVASCGQLPGLLPTVWQVSVDFVVVVVVVVVVHLTNEHMRWCNATEAEVTGAPFISSLPAVSKALVIKHHILVTFPLDIRLYFILKLCYAVQRNLRIKVILGRGDLNGRVTLLLDYTLYNLLQFKYLGLC